jgi:hypothetical protein
MRGGGDEMNKAMNTMRDTGNRAAEAVKKLGDVLRKAQQQYVEQRMAEGCSVYQANDEWFRGLK